MRAFPPPLPPTATAEEMRADLRRIRERGERARRLNLIVGLVTELGMAAVVVTMAATDTKAIVTVRLTDANQ